MTATKASQSTFAHLFHEALAASLDAHVHSNSIDMEGWFAEADRRFHATNRQMLTAIEREAVESHKHDLLRRFIRSSRDARIEHIREIGKIARAAARSQRIEQIALESGEYVAKRIVDCTRQELRILAEQYEKRALSMSRRAMFYRRIDHQLALAGLGEAETLQDWIGQQGAVSTGTEG